MAKPRGVIKVEKVCSRQRGLEKQAKRQKRMPLAHPPAAVPRVPFRPHNSLHPKLGLMFLGLKVDSFMVKSVRLHVLTRAGLPYAILSLIEAIMVNMSKPTMVPRICFFTMHA